VLRSTNLAEEVTRTTPTMALAELAEKSADGCGALPPRPRHFGEVFRPLLQ
jgi:hypothetical protein